MQDLRTYSDQVILETTEKLIKTERETTNQILQYLLENERRRIFAKEGFSARETERKLLSLASEKSLQVQLEKVRPVTENLTELKVTLNAETLAALEKLKGLLSHRNPNLSWSELIKILTDMALKKLDPEREVRPRKSSAKDSESPTKSTQTPTLKVTDRKPIPAALKRQIWQRDQGRCQYQDLQSGKFCHSQRFLEIEHRVPVSKGGQNSLMNLVLYCKYHNQLSAIETIGRSLMEKWISTLKPD